MSSLISEPISLCRLCGCSQIEEILDVSAQPPANSLYKRGDTPPSAVPLILCRCESCGAIQLTETVDPHRLFSSYVWVTGTSEVANEYSQTFAANILARVGNHVSSVLEIASNDGTFLRPFLSAGFRVLGVDPAQNIAAYATSQGIPTAAEFFGRESAAGLIVEHGKFDVVFARNVIPHVKDPHDVIGGMVSILNPDGLLAIEFHRADIILEDLHYDSIYHEHLFYHTLASMERLLREHGMSAFDVTISPISGGSYVAYFSRELRKESKDLVDARLRESQLGVLTSQVWKSFAKRCEAHREEFRNIVLAYAAAGKKIIGFGASARSSTLLNFAGLDSTVLFCISDNNPLKSGLLTPGTNIPVVSSEEAFASSPDVVILLAWNFAEEIVDEIRTKFGWTGDVIIPLPGSPRMISLS